MTDIILISPHLLEVKGQFYPCASGKGGIKDFKIEGDGATPKGFFPLREVYYRSDRLEPPKTSLPLLPLLPHWGWCDDQKDPHYNQKVSLPYPARHEELWRQDHVYDIIVVVGYNDDPIVPGKGSAIFMHLARPNYEGTEGCIALSLEHMLEVLKDITPETYLHIPS